MSEPNNIDMFKNDVRYRDNIAHFETIPAKKASFKKVDNLNEKIVDYLDSRGVKLYKHQAETYEAIKNNENLNEAVSALQVLGYNRREIEKAIDNVKLEDLSVEEIIKQALKLLGK